MKKKVCIVVASRANYGRVKCLMTTIAKHENLELQLILGASTLLERFGKAINCIKADGFKPNKSIYYVVEGENLSTQAKSTGLGIIELASAFEELEPDAVITVADRYETMATAIAATYMNIKLIHLQGGEESGNIDNRVRHAITQLADYHFACSELAAERVSEMRQSNKNVFNFGCPAIDILTTQDLSINNRIMEKYSGTGHKMNWEEPYMLIVQHPVTTSYGMGFNQMIQTLNALLGIKDLQKVVLWPNIDAGSDDVSKAIRVFREANKGENIYYHKNFGPDDYARVINNASCCIGNSSSFIRECSFLGVPAVIVGDRQEGREHGKNVIFVDYIQEEIENKIKLQLEKKRFDPEYIFGKGNSAKLIADKIYDILH
tara:strand:- start:92 stop:1219 length:1128 start_codon:yes stop_codon:yes gene_type:complete